MVLKRIMVTTLGALGLGALAAGSAFGQAQAPGTGNIPAPNLFDDQIACSMNVPTGMALQTPTVVPMGAMVSPLDTAIGMGMSTINFDDNTADDFVDVGFVVPAMVANCGSLDSTVEAFSATGDDAQGPVATDVAEGYTTVLDRYVAVYGDPGDVDETGAAGTLAMARSARAMADDDASDATIEALDDAVEDAQKAYDRALTAFNAVAQGPIYQAGVAEWMAKAAVTEAADKYNDAVTDAYGDDGTGGSYAILNALTYGEYVPLQGGELFATSGVEAAVTITDGMAVVNHAFLAEYANQAGTNQATVDDDGVTTVAADGSNFDSAGRLVVPMATDVDDVDGDDAVDDLIPVYATSANTVADIRTRRDNAKLAADALKKALDENSNPLRQAVLEEAYRRARIESDYYNRQMTNTLADTETQTSSLLEDDPDTDDENESMTNIASRYAAYIKDSNARADAEADLRAKTATREAATAAVVSQFTSPASFYDQLVARRQALKAEADKVVADATNPSESQTDAADDAADALAAAQKAQSDYQALIGDDPDDPVAALIDELLKTDGDDGKALVDAISATYDTAAGAADAAREVVNELTGEGGAVATNTAGIAENADNITAIDARVAANEDEIWDADGNSRIDANETRSTENRSMIMTNAGNIATNATNIMGLRTDVDSNMGRIGQNEMDIMMNAGNIADNTTAIGMNADAIAANMNSIGSNSSAISDNRNMIGELSDDLDVVRAGVAASMALAGMPAINGRGISIGVGSFDGESAFAVGFQVQGEMASFKVGVTSASGATGASAGVGFQF